MRRPGKSNDDLITIPAAARRLGISAQTLRRQARQGAFPTYQIGVWPRVRIREVLAAVRRPLERNDDPSA